MPNICKQNLRDQDFLYSLQKIGGKLQEIESFFYFLEEAVRNTIVFAWKIVHIWQPTWESEDSTGYIKVVG